MFGFGIGVSELTVLAAVSLFSILALFAWRPTLRSKASLSGLVVATLAAVLLTPADAISTLIVAPILYGFFQAGVWASSLTNETASSQGISD